MSKSRSSFSKVQPILERRLLEAITATASMIIGAWDAAGRPVFVSGTRALSRECAHGTTVGS